MTLTLRVPLNVGNIARLVSKHHRDKQAIRDVPRRENKHKFDFGIPILAERGDARAWPNDLRTPYSSFYIVHVAGQHEAFPNCSPSAMVWSWSAGVEAEDQVLISS